MTQESAPPSKVPNPGAAVYRRGMLHIEDVPVARLAEQFGTPLYVYSSRVLREQFRALEAALKGISEGLLICYALKANGNPALARIIRGMGGGADVVSGGEIYLARHARFPGNRTVFAGVGKTPTEMAEALHARVRAFHVESIEELDTLARVASEQKLRAGVSARVNPSVDAHTHPHITTGTSTSKFGVGPDEALDMMRRAARSRWLKPVGLHAHIGSQLPRVQPILDATERLLGLWDALSAEGIHLSDLDIGGGLGIPYMEDDRPEGPQALAHGLRPLLAGRRLTLVVEPGRFLVGPAGALLTRVLYTKRLAAEGGISREVAVVDAGMNDLLRPALYGARHPVLPLEERALDSGEPVDVVGPVCESADVLARERRLGPIRSGDLLTVGQAGAYGYSMSSQYNARLRPAEVLVNGKQARLIRRRESYEDLLASAL